MAEFLQLIWQLGGLSFFWYIGPPSYKGGDERKEELIRDLLQVDSKDAEKIISNLEKKYSKK